jgi:hypothetical protein
MGWARPRAAATTLSCTRVAGYEPAWCDLLYEGREIFETPTRHVARPDEHDGLCAPYGTLASRSTCRQQAAVGRAVRRTR